MDNNADYLGFSKKCEEYLDTYIFEEQEVKGKNPEYKIKSGMNFITGCWGSGKTTFIEEIINKLQGEYGERKKCKYLSGKKDVIVIRFDPWNFQSTKSIYKHFFDTFISGLLEFKYDSKIKGYGKDFLNILEKSGNSYLKLLSSIFYDGNNTIENLITKLNKSLTTTYSDYIILIVIDELDRIEKEDLLNVGKILNLVKSLIKENEQFNLFCIYSADSNHLLNYYLGENKGGSIMINLYQYYRKFTDSTYDVYINSKKGLISHMANSIANFYLSLNPSYAYEINKSEIYNRCETLFNSLNEKSIGIPIRDLIFYLNDLGRSQKRLLETIKPVFLESFYEKVLDGKTVEKYVGEIIVENQNIGLDFINIKSIFEKDFSIIASLDKIHSLLQNIPLNYENNDKTKINIISDFCKNQHFIIPSFEYKYSNNDEIRNLIEFIENDYLLVRGMIEKSNLDFWYDYLIGKFEKELGNDLMSKKFEDIENLNDKLSIVFYPRYNRKFQLYSNNHFTRIAGNLNLINAGGDEELLFFKNSIEIFKRYLLFIEEKNWDEIDNRDYGFIITAIMFLSKYFKDYSRNLNLFEDNGDTIEIVEGENYNTVKNALFSFIKELVERAEESDKISFIPLYFLIRLFRYSYFQNFEDKRPEMSLIIGSCIEELGEIKENSGDFNLKEQDSQLYKIGIFIVSLLNSYLENNGGDIINSIGLTLSNLPEVERVEIEKEKISLVEIVIYSLFLNGTLFENKLGSAHKFLNKFVSDKKYLFLLICYALEYEYGFNDEIHIRMSFPSDLLSLYKQIYSELVKGKGVEFFVEKYFNDIYLFSTENFSVVPMHINKILLNNKHLNEKKLRKILVDSLDNIFKKS